MHTKHEHHEGNGSHEPNLRAGRGREEPPAEPGYPEHPEQPHPAGNLRGSEASSTHPPQHGHGTHAAHESGHDKHEGHNVGMFRSKFWISLLLTIPTLIWGHMLPELLGVHPPMFPGSGWIAPIFGAVVFFYGGWVFIQGAVRELKDRLPGMMTLISLAILVAFTYSVATLLGFPGMPLWEEVASLVTIMLLGHWLEMKSVMQASGALKQLAKLLPDVATRLMGDRTEEVPVSDLRT